MAGPNNYFDTESYKSLNPKVFKFYGNQQIKIILRQFIIVSGSIMRP